MDKIVILNELRNRLDNYIKNCYMAQQITSSSENVARAQNNDKTEFCDNLHDFRSLCEHFINNISEVKYYTGTGYLISLRRCSIKCYMSYSSRNKNQQNYLCNTFSLHEDRSHYLVGKFPLYKKRHLYHATCVINIVFDIFHIANNSQNFKIAVSFILIILKVTVAQLSFII